MGAGFMFGLKMFSAAGHSARAVFSMAVILAALCTAAFPAKAAPGNTVLFILDGSGSMWERVDGQPKIVTAKSVMTDVLSKLPPEANIGLMTYGTHRKGDCADITMLSAIGAEKPAAVAAKVRALTPKGDTPIAASLLKAGEVLKSVKGKRIIVLVTDGAEECHADPCASVKALEDQGLDVRINVVGFGLGDKQRKSVQCIADDSQGAYFDAKNVAGLKAAMDQVETEMAAAPPSGENLLSAQEGGELVGAPNADWQKVASGKDTDTTGFSGCSGGPIEAIFSFKNGRPATFSKFQILIPRTGEWVQDFELLAGDDGPTGNFRSLGKFTADNMLLVKTPYQEFTFPETTAKFFKFRILSGDHGDCANRLTQIRLVGSASAKAAQSGDKGPDNNLLSPSEGGAMIYAPNSSWPSIVDGKDGDMVGFSGCGSMPFDTVFAFKDGRAAQISKFEILIPSSGEWVENFELLAANDSPTGLYRSLGKFTAANIRMVQSPYQSFSFAPATARYFKFRVLSATHGDCNNAMTQIRLAGTLTGPAMPAPKPPAGINLLSPAQGGKIVSTTLQRDWTPVVSGKDGDMQRFSACGDAPFEIVFAFKGGRAAKLSAFEMLIPQTGQWVQDFEVLASDAPKGTYRSLGKFSVQNFRLIQDPYQRFTLPPATAKFFKLRVLSGGHGDCDNRMTQIRLIGNPI